MHPKRKSRAGSVRATTLSVWSRGRSHRTSSLGNPGDGWCVLRLGIVFASGLNLPSPAARRYWPASSAFYAHNRSSLCPQGLTLCRRSGSPHPRCVVGASPRGATAAEVLGLFPVGRPEDGGRAASGDTAPVGPSPTRPRDWSRVGWRERRRCESAWRAWQAPRSPQQLSRRRRPVALSVKSFGVRDVVSRVRPASGFRGGA